MQTTILSLHATYIKIVDQIVAFTKPLQSQSLLFGQAFPCVCRQVEKAATAFTQALSRRENHLEQIVSLDLGLGMHELSAVPVSSRLEALDESVYCIVGQMGKEVVLFPEPY